MAVIKVADPLNPIQALYLQVILWILVASNLQVINNPSVVLVFIATFLIKYPAYIDIEISQCHKFVLSTVTLQLSTIIVKSKDETNHS